jgi:uncharacterized protein
LKSKIMQFIQQTNPNRAITKLDAQSVTIGEQRFSQSFWADSEAAGDFDASNIAELRLDHVEQIAARAPDVVLLGTGSRIEFPSQLWRAAFLSRRIGIEVMDLPAAARTFNVLLGEQRRVLLLALLPRTA